MIFVAYLVEKASADELQSKTNIPVVVLSYGKSATFDDEVYKSISLIGKITASEERSAQAVDYFNARNVVDETGKTGSVMIDKEKLLSWNPDIVFIDESGYGLVRDDYKKNPQFYQSLNAFKKGEVYGEIPFNYYSTNLDTAMADAYYAGKVIYPEQFKDIDSAQKADEIYQFLLGKPLYDQMAKDFGGFKKLDFNAQ